MWVSSYFFEKSLWGRHLDSSQKEEKGREEGGAKTLLDHSGLRHGVPNRKKRERGKWNQFA